jgi:hypothetical protein
MTMFSSAWGGVLWRGKAACRRGSPSHEQRGVDGRIERPAGGRPVLEREDLAFLGQEVPDTPTGQRSPELRGQQEREHAADPAERETALDE